MPLTSPKHRRRNRMKSWCLHPLPEQWAWKMKKADKSGAPLAIILGENEMQNGQVGIKYLREERQQETLQQDELPAFLNHFITQT